MLFEYNLDTVLTLDWNLPHPDSSLHLKYLS